MSIQLSVIPPLATIYKLYYFIEKCQGIFVIALDIQFLNYSGKNTWGIHWPLTIKKAREKEIGG